MSEDKRFDGNKKYAILSKESIRLYGEATGHPDISDEVAGLLTEDVVYRLREITQSSCQFMRHAKRRKLTTTDFNKALKNGDVEPVVGFGAAEQLSFRQTREGELHFVEDSEISLASVHSSTIEPHKVAQPTVKAFWLAVEGHQKGATLSQGLHGKVNGKLAKSGVSEDLLQYYDNVTKAILGHDEEIMKIALVDMRSNQNIAPILPYLINFFANGVKTASHDASQLLKLLHTVRALANNKALYLEPQPYLSVLLRGVMSCVTEPLAASFNPLNDHWMVRDYAARLLAKITRDWDSASLGLQEEKQNCLQEVLYDLSKPLCSHYGAIMGLLSFGIQAIEDILLPHLPNYWAHLVTILDDITKTNDQVKADAHKVRSALLMAAEYVIHVRTYRLMEEAELSEDKPSPLLTDPHNVNQTTDPQAPSMEEPTTSTPIKPGMKFTDGDLIGTVLELPENTNPYRILADIYQELYGYFGDSLAMKLPIKQIDNYYVVARRDEVQAPLVEEQSKQTGEELLKQFLNAEPVPVVELKPEVMEVTEIMEEVRSEVMTMGEVEVEDTDMRSDIIYEQTPDDLDMDFDVDEKSEPWSRSERSSRSSRSDRSHSDENLSFLGDDTDLTVKATVSDPSLGIKLTITKRPKIKPVEVSPKDNRRERHDSSRLKSESKRKKKKEKTISARELFFEKSTFQKKDPVTFVFRFQGREQKCSSTTLTKVKHKVIAPVVPPSEYRRLVAYMKPYGRGRVTRKAIQRFRIMHTYGATISSIT